MYTTKFPVLSSIVNMLIKHKKWINDLTQEMDKWSKSPVSHAGKGQKKPKSYIAGSHGESLYN